MQADKAERGKGSSSKDMGGTLTFVSEGSLLYFVETSTIHSAPRIVYPQTAKKHSSGSAGVELTKPKKIPRTRLR